MAQYPVSVSLSRSLKTHKGDMPTLVLNEPLTRSFVKHGEPFKVRMKDGSPDVEFNNNSVLGFLADMSGVDELILQDLPTSDFYKLRNKLSELLTQDFGTDESPTQA